MTMHPDLKRGLITGAAVAALFGVFALGGGTGYGTARATAPDPEPCLVALDRADDMIYLSTSTIGLIGTAMDQYQADDIAGLNETTAKIKAKSDKASQTDYVSPRNECREVFGR